MNVVIVGGHGKVALRLEKLLAERGDSPRGIIRTTDQAKDLEDDRRRADRARHREHGDRRRCGGADAVVFAAGAGAGSGPARKRTVDFDGAVKLIKAAERHGIRRYVMVSAMGANHPERWSDQMRPYYEAKAAADRHVLDSGLDYTIVRPGRLTDDPGTGTVEVAEKLETGRSVTRDDVAAVIVECLVADNTIGKSFDVLNDGTPIAEAVRSL